ncbi:lectin C-type domain protein [Ancylostoma duodenale]|uniref:Lectin C-type domain protein n=1 Tax=Ancylostoma duodenale TaxID=51022 RepID=A0A0C2FFN3_9BILA|nr:lectin C-type domain protein [Ancylostoma duodenale]
MTTLLPTIAGYALFRTDKGSILRDLSLWDFSENYYFGTVSNQESYNDAEDDCKRIGGHLPSISNAYQNAAVQDAVHKLLGTNNGGKIILGYSNLINYGFSWSDGNPSTYTNWAPGGNKPVSL